MSLFAKYITVVNNFQLGQIPMWFRQRVDRQLQFGFLCISSLIAIMEPEEDCLLADQAGSIQPGFGHVDDDRKDHH